MADKIPATIHSPGKWDIPWREFISKAGWSGDISLGVDESKAVMVVDVPWRDVYQLGKEILGYGIKSGTKIHRVLPKPHPIFHWLKATRITKIEGVGFEGVEVPPDNGQYLTAKYKIARVWIAFETPRYDVIPDEDSNFEWDRFVIKESTTTGEFITREGGSFVFPPGTPNNPGPFKGSRAQSLIKKSLIWTWVQVPDLGLFDTGSRLGRPLNIDEGLNKVNDNDFAGYPAGTLLFSGVKFEPISLPIAPEALGLPPDGPPRAWNVTFNFTYFEPPHADMDKRGHNLVPHPTNGLWYRAILEGGTDDPQYWRYQEYDFDKLFQMN